MRTFDPISAPLHGTTLVEASAGTGKTFTITTLVVRLLLEQGLGIDEILIVTFTEAAAAELRHRVRDRLTQAVAALQDPSVADPQLATLLQQRAAQGHAAADAAILVGSIRAFDEAAISTIHGFCHRVLSDSAFESGVPFDTELVADETPMLEEALRDFWAQQLYGSDPRFVRWLDEKRITPRKLMTLARLAVSHVDATVVPAKVRVGGAGDVAVYTAAYERARALYRRDHVELRDRLDAFAHFSQRTHKPGQLGKLLVSLDEFFKPEQPGTATEFAGMAKLTPDGLRKGTRKKYIDTGGEPPSHPLFDALGALLQASAPLRADLAQRELQLRVKLVQWLRRELPKRKAAAGVLSFDDLLQRLDGALRRRGSRTLAKAIRQRYRAALIDEFQDTDPMQYRIFQAIYGGSDRPLLLIGDPKQAIYAFRGADVFAYIEAAAAAGERRYTMDRNWRSDPALVDAVAHLFDVRRPFMLKEIQYVDVAPRPGATAGLHVDGAALPAFEVLFQARDGAETNHKQITIEWADRTIPAVIAADISRLLASGATVSGPHGPRPLHAGDIAVLVRKNTQAMLVGRALRALAVPSVVYGDATVFQTREAAELSRVLAAVAEPTHSGRLRAAITTEMFGVTAQTLETMQGTSEEADQQWAAWVDDFRRWHTIWAERGFVQMFRALIGARGIQERILAMLDGERRMTNLLHLAELLHTAAKAEHLGPTGLLTWLAQERVRAYSHAEAVKLRLERDDRAVQLVTVHRSKGLEYPVVYCPWLWDGTQMFDDEEEFLLWHDPEQGHRAQLDVRLKARDKKERGSDPAIAAARAERAAENLRLLYVAVTRARHRCVVIWGPFGRFAASPLGYLVHSPEVDERWPWDPAQIEAKIKDADDTKLGTWLRDRAGQHWHVRPMAIGEAVPYVGEPMAGLTLQCRASQRGHDDGIRTTSFSALAAANQAQARDPDARDHDESAVGDDTVELATLARAPGSPPVALADFPRGAKAGNFFHDVLERLPFDAARESIATLVADRLDAHGFDAPTWGQRVTEAVVQILATPIRPDGPSLSQIPGDARLVEMEFLLPLCGGAPMGASRHDADAQLAATRASMAAAFARHPEGLPVGYADRLARLGFSPLRGFLKGFIDLVIQHDGRWYVIDYKTNHLGNDAEAYTPARMGEVMGHDHYVLQYHLYTVAVIQHLRRHDPGLDYERDFGGAIYLFLRGMDPSTGATRGVYFERPPKARIEALTALMLHGTTEGAR